ncbi:hypothetical protein [Massilia antarctica]|uniref:hypothetical protein n=1 Tax=Massilia antarctica TaxID=2765360 RepID=UPI0006BB9118|nr:hypothetical protein [Massilia sp. H27-R4]MCY0911129.1 hypothetical protein [Massilia sp. H27-R4]CUI05287.1 putative phage tail protein [Janthinobacterium sp. CG23_2]CUU29073.1 putative phage tail protein [Janthinobacterium sp. CG23_2]
MPDTTNTTTVKLDTSQAEAGLKRIDEALAKTGRTLDSLGGSTGMDKLAAETRAAAAAIADSSATINDAIASQKAMLQEGEKAMAAFLSASEGAGPDPARLIAFVDQLDQTIRTTDLGASAQMVAAKKAVAALDTVIGSVKGSLAAFGADMLKSLTLDSVVAGIKAAIDTLADLDGMAARTGASVENLSRLQKVAQMTGQDFAQVDTAVSRLGNAMKGVGDDSAKVNAALVALGVATKDASKNLRDPSEVLIDVSENLQKYADGAGKTILVNNLLGKSNEKLAPYLNDLADNIGKFSGSSAKSAAAAAAYSNNMGELKVRLGELGTSVAENLLPPLLTLTTFLADVAASEGFKTFVEASGEAVSVFAGIISSVSTLLEPAAKIAAAYFTVFVAVPTICGLAGMAMTALGGAVIGLKTALSGASVGAQLADGSLTKLKLAGSLLIALFAGWEIGTYLRDQFVEVRVAGLAFVGAMLTGWEKLSYAAVEAWDAIGIKWHSMLAGLLNAYAGFVQAVANGMGTLGMGSMAADAAKDAESLRKLSREQQALADQQTKAAVVAKREHEEKLARIDREITSLVAFEIADDATRKAKKPAAAAVAKPQLPVPATPAKKETDKTGTGAVASVQGVPVPVVKDSAAAEAWMAQQTQQLAKNQELADAEVMAAQKTAAACTASAAAIVTLTMTRKDDELERARAIDSAGLHVVALASETAALKGNADAARAAGQPDAVPKIAAVAEVSMPKLLPEGLTKDLDKALDPAAAKKFGEVLAEAFGGAGKALGKLTSALVDYGGRQKKFADERAGADHDLKKGAIDQIEHGKKISEINAKSTKSQMAGFSDMAGAAAEFFDKQSTGYKVLTTVSKVFHAAELAMTLAELVPKGIGAILSQAQGDPYTAFARMAAMAAIVAALGVATGGIGASGEGGAKAADVQKSQGSGTVMGDPEAKSESITRALELIENNTYQGLDYSAGMLSSLRNIESSMSGLSSMVMRTGGVTDGGNLGIATGQLGSSGFFKGLWGKTTQTIVDSGIQFGGSLDNLQQGVGYQQYASVDTTKSSVFGLRKRTSNSVQLADLDADLSKQFGMIFTDLEATLKGAAVSLGLSATDVSSSLDQLVLESTTLSLKDLKGEDLTAAINAVLSKAMDQISAAAFPSLKDFSKIGEGYAETVVRVSMDFQAINTVFASFGKVFGQVGLESIGARERLIAMAGGLEEFTSQGEFFLKNFFTEKDQTSALTARIEPTLQTYGLSTQGEDATKRFKDFVIALDTTTDAGARTYTALMQLAPAFAEIVKSAASIYEERRNLTDQLASATLDKGKLADKARNEIDPSNRDLYDKVQLATTDKGFSDQIAELKKAAMPLAEQRALEVAGMKASTLALYEELEALQAQAKQRASAETTNAKNRALEIQNMELSGDKAGALAAARADELKGLAASTAALVINRNALQDQADIAATARADAATLASANKVIQDQIDNMLKAGMTKEELRAAETKGMKKETIELYDKLAAMKLAEQQAQAVRQAEEVRLADGKRLAEEAERAAEQLRDAWKSVTEAIFDEVKRLRGLIDGASVNSVASAQSAFTIATAQARSGDMDAGKMLPALSQKLIELAEANATSMLDLQRVRAQTAASLTVTGAMTSLNALKAGPAAAPSVQGGMPQAGAYQAPMQVPQNWGLQGAAGANPEAQRLQAEVEGLRAETRATATHTAKLVSMLSRLIVDDVLKTKETA